MTGNNGEKSIKTQKLRTLHHKWIFIKKTQLLNV